MPAFLPLLHVGVGTRRGPVTLFPVWIDGAGTPGLGWDARPLAVQERAGSAVVAELVVRNTSARPRAVLEGDLFVGGRQDRTAADTTVLGAGESRVLPVRCVEHGRWSGGVDHRATAMRTPYSVRYGSRAGTTARPDQGEVWERIARLERRHGASETAALTAHLPASRAHRGEPARSFVRARPDLTGIRPLEGQRGILVGIGGRIVAAELFGSARGLRTRWEGILDAAALDAAGHADAATTGQSARDFAERLGSTPRRDAIRAGRLRHISAGDAHTAVATSWTTDAAGRRTGLLHATAYNRAHPALV